ncbi:sterol desaturase family protein [Roseateles albus]|uniref:Sterol desaturase family protein n=1 Tax=Roseateles albus TaxID=2987525 RepID=A0ABT5K7Z6_9BURK|nr:sterol desaturase family protein [Roseateles albus]MDC8770075.1 sterol desaturase family protein [Roseateles albus]
MDLVPEALPWLLVLIGLVLVSVTLEGVVRSFVLRLPYDWRAYAASMADFGGRRAVDALGLSLASPLLVWAYDNRLQTISLAGPVAFLLLVIGQELCYYGYHRAAHRVGWFWATHAVHHSSNELSLAGRANSPARRSSSRR